LLDKVAKHKPLTGSNIKILKAKKLIEGRKPNFHISDSVAKVTGQEADYIKLRGIDDKYIQKVITDYLKKFDTGKRKDFENILLKKLPDILTIEQKRTKIKNNLQYLRKQGVITIKGKLWEMSKNR